MSKYSPLQTHLEKSTARNVSMTFVDIEKIIGCSLPPSSRAHRAWWSNNPTNNVMTKSWLEAGYKTVDVDIAAGKLVFQRPSTANDNRHSHESEVHDCKTPRRNPLFGMLKGTVTVPDGVDLTAPADLNWGKVNE